MSYKKIDYQALYEKLKNEIEDQLVYWRNKEAEQFTTENRVRASEYGRLQALIIGLEKNAIDDAIDEAYNK